MRRFLCEISDELHAAIAAALAGSGRSKNAAIERWLWACREIRDAAKRAGIDRPAERKRGRPPKQS